MGLEVRITGGVVVGEWHFATGPLFMPSCYHPTRPELSEETSS